MHLRESYFGPNIFPPLSLHFPLPPHVSLLWAWRVNHESLGENSAAPAFPNWRENISDVEKKNSL